MPPSAKVYVIDDDPAMRDSLDFLLGSAGFSVRLFDSAQAFPDELANLETGCVVTDVRMPGIDGMELLRRLSSGPRKLPVHRHDRPWRRAPRRRGDEAWRARFSRKAVRG
jgi:Response regulator